MERIKKYFSEWDAARIIRQVFGIILWIAFYFNREPLFIFAGTMLTIQAVFNISCAGGSCGTNYTKSDKPIIKIDKYEPKN